MDLLPDQLASLWRDVEQHRATAEDYCSQERELLGEYATTWADALRFPGCDSLEESVLTELAAYYRQEGPEQVRARCLDRRPRIAEAWRKEVDPDDRRSIDAFYDQCEVEEYIHALMYWHTLVDENSPLAYVAALRFAQEHGCRDCLDFGAGVGSGGLLFERNGLPMAMADISSPMLEFGRWRFERRGMAGRCIDLKAERLPEDSYDFIAAMDVFEHLSDPIGTLDHLARSLRPGGFLYGRFATEDDDDHPLHIVRDFAPIFTRMEELGFVEAWADEWVWGHKVFRKGG